MAQVHVLSLSRSLSPMEAANAHVAHVVVDEAPVPWPLVLGLDDTCRDHLLLDRRTRQDRATNV